MGVQNYSCRGVVSEKNCCHGYFDVQYIKTRDLAQLSALPSFTRRISQDVRRDVIRVQNCCCRGLTPDKIAVMGVSMFSTLILVIWRNF